MTYAEIGSVLGITEDMARRAFLSGIPKLKADEKIEPIIATIHGVADERGLIGCGSIECDKEAQKYLYL